MSIVVFTAMLLTIIIKDGYFIGIISNLMIKTEGVNYVS